MESAMPMGLRGAGIGAAAAGRRLLFSKSGDEEKHAAAGEKADQEPNGDANGSEADASGMTRGDDATAQGAELAQKVKDLEAALAGKEEENKGLKDNMLRTLADMENLRERTSRQMENASKFAIQGFVKSLLDVSDNMERALAVVEAKYLEEANEEAESKSFKLLKSLHEGIQMTEKQMLQTFERNGLERYDPTGDAFDPNLHEAKFEIPPQDGKAPGSVAVVTKAGFKLHGRVIRPAEVGVFQEK